MAPIVFGVMLGVGWCSLPNRAGAALEPLRWRWSNPRPHGNNVIGMAYSAALGLGVQVAERGQLYSSDDLIFWIPRETGTTNALRDVTFFGTRLIVTGESGLVLWADSVESFQPGALMDGPTGDWLEGVAASPTLVVAVGDNGAIYTSPDGVRWKRQQPGFNDWLTDVAWGNGGFLAVGYEGVVASSFDGTNWLRRQVGSTDWYAVDYANGRYTIAGAGGTIRSSVTRGMSWTAENSGATNTLYTVCTAGLARVAAGDDVVLLNEGAGWTDVTAQPDGPPSWTYLSSLGMPGFFLLAGRTGEVVEGYKTNSMPFYWIETEASIRPWLFDVKYADGLYVAVGDRATVMTSEGGVDWTLELVPASVTNEIFLGVGGTSNMLVAAGSAGSLIISPDQLFTNIVETNIDGRLEWITNIVSGRGVLWYPVEPRPTSRDLQGVTPFGDGFVVVGDQGTILTSPDATNWTLRASPTTKFLSGVTAFPGGLVATGDDGTVLTSPDGIVWTARESGTLAWLYRVRYLGGQLVAVGQNGTILTSSDGVSWTKQSSGTAVWLHDVTWIDGAWYAVGKEGTVVASTNLAQWTSLGTITLKSLYAAATDGSQLIAAGLEGSILRSPVVPDLTPIEILSFDRIFSEDGTRVENLYLFGGHPDQRFRLEARAELGQGAWVSRQQLEIFDSSGLLYYVESSPIEEAPPKEFYQATLDP